MLAKTARRNIDQIASAYARATNRSRHAISKELCGRGNVIDDYVAGRVTMSMDKLDALVTAFRKKWPKGAEWPFTAALHMRAR